jgi:hypothetical protein
MENLTVLAWEILLAGVVYAPPAPGVSPAGRAAE